ncbi:MAG: hypothetical protein IKG55_08705 [Solobacterium sp.]|nr:hypothetical protein [Erysipelotrichaceae bacterium]MBR3350138.1 hypothetical protein [Solobacterium sp.]
MINNTKQLKLLEEYLSRYDEIKGHLVCINVVDELESNPPSMALNCVKMLTYLTALVVVFLVIKSIVLKVILSIILIVILIYLVDAMSFIADVNSNWDAYLANRKESKVALEKILSRYKTLLDIEGFPPADYFMKHNVTIILRRMRLDGVDVKKAIELEKDNILYTLREVV